MSNHRANSIIAEIRLRNERVGILSKQGEKKYRFQYDRQYLEKNNAIPISIKFPLSAEAYESPVLHPFFDNLIMEGWLLNHVEKNFHIDKKNRWALLMMVGGNPIGAVSIHALDTNGKILPSNYSIEDSLDQTKLYPIKIPSHKNVCSFCLNDLKEKMQEYHSTCYKKFWNTSRALSLRLHEQYPLQTFSQTILDGSISGAQRKGLFTLIGSELRVNSEKSMYILKPDGDFPELPANEHLTMSVAQRLKFDVPPTGLIEIEKVGYIFVIKRFDRIADSKRLLVEDMAQIYGEASEDKYTLSHEKIGEAIESYTQAGPLNLNDFFRRIMFCYLTANGDMHLKNWSLVEMEKNLGVYRLSPAYDWLNTRIVLAKEKNDLAIPLRGKQRNMKSTYFRKFATDDLKIDGAFVKKVFTEVGGWRDLFEELVPKSFLSAAMKRSYLKMVHQRFEILKEKL